jgi:hypothetical protein
MWKKAAKEPLRGCGLYFKPAINIGAGFTDFKPA